ncbi:hypothetical protein [Streptomyces sp. AM 3-1-1]|uniref:hypothetical protein n=1 Tax=Streptomyces sp. AM 3-1-1 TaxID=3028711 RepID=UPI0023B94E60|nr:hypothetical protein [Streptomyces sp. AM 3-1-1]WEH30993.1 hypothetical protein P0D76_28725 [Streptomyces sp. AM 3-1-1]
MELQPRTGRDVTAWGPDIAIPAVLPSKTVPDGGLVIHHQGAWTSERFVGAAGRGCRLEDVVARHPPSYAVLDVRTRWVTTCALPYGARRALLPVVGGRRSGPRRPPTTGGRDRVDGEPAPAEHRENRRQDRHDPYRTSGRHCAKARPADTVDRVMTDCRGPPSRPPGPFVLLAERRPSARSDCPPHSPSNWAVVCLSGTTPTPLTTPAPGASPTAQPW